jgi:hypothetical protein
MNVSPFCSSTNDIVSGQCFSIPNSGCESRTKDRSAILSILDSLRQMNLIHNNATVDRSECYRSTVAINCWRNFATELLGQRVRLRMLSFQQRRLSSWDCRRHNERERPLRGTSSWDHWRIQQSSIHSQPSTRGRVVHANVMDWVIIHSQ